MENKDYDGLIYNHIKEIANLVEEGKIDKYSVIADLVSEFHQKFIEKLERMRKKLDESDLYNKNKD